MAQLDYRALAVLDAVASHGSFDKAALALGISQSAVSQRIKALEDSSGRLLIIRGQPALPTGLGQRLITHFRHVQLMEASLDIDLGRQTSLPEVSIALDSDSLAGWFSACLPALLSPPRCQLDVRVAASDLALQLLREGSVFGAVAASASTPAPAGQAGTTASQALGQMVYVCVATPAFAGHWFGDGLSVPAARLAAAVVGERALLASFLDQELGLEGPFPHHTIAAAATRQACIEGGMAYGLLPQPQAAPALADRRLVDLAPGCVLQVPLSWHAWNLDTPFSKLLSEQVVRSARAWLQA